MFEEIKEYSMEQIEKREAETRRKEVYRDEQEGDASFNDNKLF